jgi:chitin disaccharide deacetylase
MKLKNRERYIKIIFISISFLFSILIIVSGKNLNAKNKSQVNDTTTIKLIMRADDMGSSNDNPMAIIKAFKEGIITSASIMPLATYFEDAVRLCKDNPTLAVGVHITLLGTRTRPLLSPDIIPSIVTKEGFLYEILPDLNRANPKAEEMEKEIRAQINKVRDSGLHFVYLDWHRGVPESAKEIIIKICKEQQLIYSNDWNGNMYGYKRIILMQESWPNKKTKDGKLTWFETPAFTPEEQQLFYDALSNLKPGLWMTNVHPGFTLPQRASVTELLCSPITKKIIKLNKIQLVSYEDLWNEEFGKADSR